MLHRLFKRPPVAKHLDANNPDIWTPSPGSRTTASGENVSPDGALQISAYFGAVRMIAEDLAKLPLILYRRLERGKERLYGDPLYHILHDKPNDQMGSMTFRETLIASALSWGNGYARVDFDGGHRNVTSIEPIHPSRVQAKLLEESGRVEYYVAGLRGQPRVTIPSDRMIHVRGLGAEGLIGYSVAQLAAESLGLTIAAQNFQASFFGNGTVFSGILEHPEKLSDGAHKRLVESWKERYVGSENAWKIKILEEGMTYRSLGMPAKDAQFLESRKFQVEEIARWFRIPPHKLGHLDKATFSNIEHQGIEYVVDSLQPWATRVEQEITNKVLAPRRDADELVVEHLFEGLLRGDQESRTKFYQGMSRIGALSINEIRARENENPIPDGDRYIIEANRTPLDRIDDALDARNEPSSEPAGVGGEPDSDELEDRDAEARAGVDTATRPAVEAAILPVILDAVSRVVRKEAKALERAARRCTGDAEGFDAWAERFVGEQTGFVREVLAVPCSVLTSDVEGVVTAAAERHVEEFRREAKQWYRAHDAAVTPAAHWLEGREAEIAERIKDDCRDVGSER